MAKVYGGLAATKQVAYAWAVAVAPEEAGVLLRRLGLGDAAVDTAIEVGAFGHAFQLAQVMAGLVFFAADGACLWGLAGSRNPFFCFS